MHVCVCVCVCIKGMYSNVTMSLLLIISASFFDYITMGSYRFISMFSREDATHSFYLL